jgi:AraC family transcriptional regulator
LLPDLSQPDAPSFSAPELARRFDGGEACAVQRCSVRDAGWSSVLIRVARRNDSSGYAGLGVLRHPRIMLVTRGSVAVRRRDGGDSGSAQLIPGKAWLVPAGEPLSYDWTEAGRGTREMTTIVLPAAELARTADALRRRRPGPASLAKTMLIEDRVVRSVLVELSHAMGSGVDELYAQSAAAFLLAHLLSNYGTGAPGPLPMGREDARVRTAIEFMRARLSLPVSLADIAASAGLSPYHFLRVFGSVTGVPPFRFLTRMRIDAARRQLQEGNLSVTEIAALCGFSSASQFSTAFRRETGMAPSEFRRAAAS